MTGLTRLSSGFCFLNKFNIDGLEKSQKMRFFLCNSLKLLIPIFAKLTFYETINIETQSLDAKKKQYGFVHQSINLDRDLSIHENLYIHGMLYHMKSREIHKLIDELLEYID